MRTSCILFIRQCYEQGLIDDEKKEKLEKYIMKQEVHGEIRKQMSNLGPKSSNKDGDDQAAYLREIISRVRPNCS